MRFRAIVEPPEPIRGVEVPDEVVTALDDGARPPVIVTINDRSWATRVALMHGRHLTGLSKAHRNAAGIHTGDKVNVEIKLDLEPGWHRFLPTWPRRWTSNPGHSPPSIA